MVQKGKGAPLSPLGSTGNLEALGDVDGARFQKQFLADAASGRAPSKMHVSSGPSTPRSGSSQSSQVRHLYAQLRQSTTPVSGGGEGGAAAPSKSPRSVGKPSDLEAGGPEPVKRSWAMRAYARLCYCTPLGAMIFLVSRPLCAR